MTKWQNEDDINARLREVTAEVRKLRQDLDREVKQHGRSDTVRARDESEPPPNPPPLPKPK